MTERVENLAQWMTQLPAVIKKQIPIINLAIPGSHDSMTYGINRRSKIAPDAEPVVRRLYKVLPCVVRRWAITQNLNALQQLNNGVRYLDLRIGMHAKKFNFYFVHGVYCEEITEPLQQIRKFMDDHPNEFIIFDCQHFYNFSNGDYARLNKILFKIFEGKFYTSDDGALNKCTLEYANSLNRQLLVIYRYHQVPKEFWGGGNWPTPWPNQIKVKKLEEYLEQNIQYRDPYTGYTRQCVLTPPVKFIVPRFYSSLKAKCAANVSKKLIDWLKVQKPGPFELNGNQPTSNVFIADFVELNNFQFCRTVIGLNDKIFKELICEQQPSNGCMAAAAAAAAADDVVAAVANDNEPQDLIKIHSNATSDNDCNDNNTLQS